MILPAIAGLASIWGAAGPALEPAFLARLGAPATAIAIAPDGDVIAAGACSGGLPATAGALASASRGGMDAFVLRLDASGRELVAATYLGGSRGERVLGVAIAPEGDVVLVGETESDDLETTPGAFDRTFGGDRDGFVARLTPKLDRLVFATYVGGTDFDIAGGAACDGDDGVWAWGNTTSPDFAPGGLESPSSPGHRAWVARFDAGGAADSCRSVPGVNPTADLRADGSVCVATLAPARDAFHIATFANGEATEPALRVAAARVQRLQLAFVDRDRLLVGGNSLEGAFRSCAFAQLLGSAASESSSRLALAGDDDVAVANAAALDPCRALLFGRTFASDFPFTSLPRTHLRGGCSAFLAIVDLPGLTLRSAVAPWTTFAWTGGYTQALAARGDVVVASDMAAALDPALDLGGFEWRPADSGSWPPATPVVAGWRLRRG